MSFQKSTRSSIATLSYREPPVLYRSLQGQRFEDISARAGPGIRQELTARGLAMADIDNDGRVEVLINSQNERPALLTQQGSASGNWIALALEGSVSNRSAIGAKVRVKTNTKAQQAEVRGGGSYLSQHDLRLHFGLGSDTQVDIDLQWPSGIEQRLEGLAAGQVHKIREPSQRD